MQCPGDGDYLLKFIANCAVEAYVTYSGRDSADNSCSSMLNVQLDDCNDCHGYEHQFTLEVEINPNALPVIANSGLPVVTTEDVETAEFSEPELQTQLSQMFLHQSVPSLAYAARISVPSETADEGRAHACHALILCEKRNSLNLVAAFDLGRP
eukprot:SAG31_NODE_5577_length_2447_cov_1.805366_4_plen_154_part_00